MPEIDELRADIAKLDAELVSLISKRLDIAKQIGEYKRQNGLAIMVPEVEATVRKRYAEEARKAGVPKETAEKIADLLISACRSVQE